MNEELAVEQNVRTPQCRGIAFRLSKLGSKVTALGAGLVFSGGQVFATLPTTAPPSRGSTSGNIIQLIQDYAYDIMLVVGLLLATMAFIMVVKNTVGAYGEIQDGKGTWGQLGMHGIAGALVIVFTVFLLTEAAAIL